MQFYALPSANQKIRFDTATQRLRHLLTLGNLGHLAGDAFLRKFLDEKGTKVEGGSRELRHFTYILLT